MDLAADITIENAELGSIRMDNISFDKKIEDPSPVMVLAPLCLWVEPSKGDGSAFENDRYRVVGEKEMEAKLQAEAAELQNDEKCILRTVQQFKQSMTDEKGSPDSPSFSAKAVEALHKLDRVRQQCTEIAAKSMQNVSFVECCALCDRVMVVVGGPKLQVVPPSSSSSAAATAETKTTGPSEAVDVAKVSDKVQRLTEKLRAATGLKNKQKRKKIQRELKVLRARLGGTSLHDESAEEAPGPSDGRV